MASVLAPPCSGPARAAIAPVTAPWTSASVAAMTRAANVEALSSWSAWRMSATSNARTTSVSGISPVSRYSVLAARESPRRGVRGFWPERRRWKAPSMVGSWAMSRTALRYSAARLSSPRSGSTKTAALTAVRNTCIGFAPAGASLMMRSTTRSSFCDALI